MNRTGPAFSDFISELRRRNRNKNDQSLNAGSLIQILPLVALAVAFSFLGLRLIFLQIVEATYYKDLSDGNRTRSRIIRAPRGIIFDRLQKPLVRNVAAYRIIDKNKKPHWIGEDEALKIIARKQVENIALDVQREYLYQDVFAHALGYIGQVSEEELATPLFKDYKPGAWVGKMGIEKQYEMLLAGVDGQELYEADAKGAIIRKLGSKEPIPGQDIHTTLDADIQESAYVAFEKVDKGVVIVSDPRNGAILALLSKPTFDPNLFTHTENYTAKGSYESVEKVLEDSTNQPFLDRAIAGAYPPGSVYKLVTASSALTNGSVTEDTEIEDTGVLKVGDFSYGNWYFSQYGKKEGVLDLIGAIKRSNDIFFYKTSQATGIENLAKTSRLFGLGDRLGIDLPEEEKGLVPDPTWKEKEIGEQWYLGDTFHVGIGQGFLLTTPLQVNMFTSVFANDGVLYKPHVLEGATQVLRKDIVSKEHAQLIRSGMKAACEPGGTGWPLFEFKVQNSKLKVDNLDYVPIASSGAGFVQVTLGCKTGTAETVADKNSHAWITVFAPYYNPEIVITVLVEHGGEGSSTAGPIAKEILTKYFEGK